MNDKLGPDTFTRLPIIHPYLVRLNKDNPVQCTVHRTQALVFPTMRARTTVITARGELSTAVVFVIRSVSVSVNTQSP